MLKFLPHVHHRVYWFSDEIWTPYSSHKIDNKFFIHHCRCWKECSFLCETVWFFSWVNTHLFDLKFVAFYPKYNGDSYVEFQEKTISGEFFRNLCKPRLSSTKTCEISPYFLQFYSGSVLRWKNSYKYFLCCLHTGKESRP